MELIDLIPEFNLYEKYWKVYSNTGAVQPQYISLDSVIVKSIIGEGSEIYGEVYSSVIGANVVIGKGSVVRGSIVMQGTIIGENVVLDKTIVAEDCRIGSNVKVGEGEYADNSFNPKVYNSELAVIGEDSVIPDNVTIGKNTAISGVTLAADYENGFLKSGDSIIKAGVKA